ncbi:hypothetical protein Glove_510g14 [Diversispora epigaea]|uniref:Uncharacterized protein n=1 Tax=Diversispora epigaea TaxID=1348612 RepID=A0A397GL89_9GLOM|nr:hypothetical protein Glove_510g14 [Diversispora epigaea]
MVRYLNIDKSPQQEKDSVCTRTKDMCISRVDYSNQIINTPICKNPLEAKKQIAYTSLPISSKSVTIWHEQTKCSELAGYRQIEDNFELDLRNRAFLSELDSKELKDNELERLTMFSTVDSLGHPNSADSALHTETMYPLNCLQTNLLFFLTDSKKDKQLTYDLQTMALTHISDFELVKVE